jgi:hypothetical protein
MEIIRADEHGVQMILEPDLQTLRGVIVLRADLERLARDHGIHFVTGAELWFTVHKGDEPRLYRIGVIEDVEEGWQRVDLTPLRPPQGE